MIAHRGAREHAADGPAITVCSMSTTGHTRLPALAGAKRLRRGLVLLVCAGVLGWALLSTTHWHDADSSRQHGAAECVLCLGMVAGAAPPGHSVLHLLPPPAALPLAEASSPAPVPAPSAAYQSRAPPAA